MSAPLPWATLLRTGLGAGLAVGLVLELSTRAMINASSAPAYVVAVGASAALVFAVPGSPFAHPWSVIGGNVISALAGFVVVTLLGTSTLAAMSAVALAIVAMQMARCLHPPGGAVALSVVIGGPGIHAAGLAYAFATVGFNMALLTLAGFAYNRGADALTGFVRQVRERRNKTREQER